MNRAVGLDACCIAVVVGYLSVIGWTVLANLHSVLEMSAWVASLGLFLAALFVIGIGSFLLLRPSDARADGLLRRICVRIVGCILIGICCGTFWGWVVLAHLQIHFHLFDSVSVWGFLGLWASPFLCFGLGLFVLAVLTEMVPDDEPAPDKEVEQVERLDHRSWQSYGGGSRRSQALEEGRLLYRLGPIP